MPKYKMIEASLIIVEREKRQRKKLTGIEVLSESIFRLGVINPITIKLDYTLVAGERRLEACKLLDENYKVPCRFYEELNDKQLHLVELEENIKREDLTWQDRALAIKQAHELYLSLDPEWSVSKTGAAIGLDQSYASKNCIVAERLIQGDEKALKAETLAVAYNAINRETERAIDNELNNLIELEREDVREHETISSNPGELHLKENTSQLRELPIRNVNFLDWVKEYSGRRFNLIHCDFPYGIDHGDSEQGGTANGRYEGYEDSKETYWSLIGYMLVNLDKIMTPSGHVMFWFSMNFYQKTIDYFEANSDLRLVMPQPLIWYKSDGRGIVSDVNRRPRNVYETALLFSRGDRKILSPIDNCYACPTAKRQALHVSEKPEPMLRHFFRMFIDSYSEVLDPTCGAGSAIRAAESLGAARCLGLEINSEFADEANAQVKRSRTLDNLSKEIEV